MSATETLGQGRLLWRCRRGMRELDVLLERYAHELRMPAAAAERTLFARLLELTDPQLAAYFFGHEIPADPKLAALVRKIAASARPKEERR